MTNKFSLFDVIGISITIPLMIGVGVFSWKRGIKKSYAKLTDLHKPIDLELTEESLYWTTARTTTQLGWHEIEKWKEGKGLLLIFSSPYCFHFIDLLALSEAELQLLQAKLDWRRASQIG